MTEMKAANRSEREDDGSEVFRPRDLAKAGAQARRGQLRRVARGIYTSNLHEPLGSVVRRNWLDVAGLSFPGAVIVDRSAVLARPTEDGSLFLDAGPSYKTNRAVDVHGLRLKPRGGPGPLAGDMPMAKLFMSSQPRTMLDNLAPSRARDGAARTLERTEFEEWLESKMSAWGADEMNRLRDEARRLATEIGGQWLGRFEKLDAILGALHGTRRSALTSPAAVSRATGTPFDPRRVELFDLLRSELLQHAPPSLSAVDDPNSVFAFFEAYFSNFVEGTEFEVEEAARIVFEGEMPAARPEDAHDILGTQRAILDPATRGVTPNSADALIELTRTLNRRVLAQRPATLPGVFKQRPNRAGATTFVAPELVEGTLLQAWRVYETLPTSYARAVFAMFAVTEVHPFNDGNGRCARLLMNAEFTAGGLPRFIVPLSYRTDYLDALRALSRREDPSLLPRMTDRILRWVTMIDWSDLDATINQLRATNALVSHEVYEADAAVLRDP